MNSPRHASVGSVVGLILLGLALVSCGGGDTEGSDIADPAGHNAADVAFATQMIPHHAQALSMVDLTMGRAVSPDAQQLTEEIRNAQAPEIEQMADWLEAWGEEVPATMRDHANAHADENADPMPGMPGMVSSDDLASLDSADDGDFESSWLTLMIEHHQGAIEMAETELADGQNADARKLAQAVIDGQTAEIETMKKLLG